MFSAYLRGRSKRGWVRMRKIAMAVLALAVVASAGCSKPVDPAVPPVGMEGTWTGNTPVLRRVTFEHGVMKTDQAGLAGEYQVKYAATDGLTGEAANALTPLSTVRTVRVEGVHTGTGRTLSLEFTVIGGTVLQDAFGALQKEKPKADG
jgi:hypothetical protein